MLVTDVIAAYVAKTVLVGIYVIREQVDLVAMRAARLVPMLLIVTFPSIIEAMLVSHSVVANVTDAVLVAVGVFSR